MHHENYEKMRNAPQKLERSAIGTMVVLSNVALKKNQIYLQNNIIQDKYTKKVMLWSVKVDIS